MGWQSAGVLTLSSRVHWSGLDDDSSDDSEYDVRNGTLHLVDNPKGIARDLFLGLSTPIPTLRAHPASLEAMTDPSQSSSASSESSSWRTEQRLAYLFGTTFVVVMLVIVLFVPEPSPFQRYVFRIVIGLAAAGVAATISGFLRVQLSSGIRAGGAISVFVIVYFFSPTTLITSSDTNSPSDDSTGSADTTQVSEWAPAAVSDSDDVMCRTLRTDELELTPSPTGDYFSVRNAGNPIAASVSESTAEEMLKLARGHTHQCLIGLGTDHPVTYWYGDSGAQVAPPSPDQCFSYVPQNLDFGPTEDGAFMIGTAEEGVMLKLASRDIAERAFALAKDHRQLCFLGFDAYIFEDIDCAELPTCWTMFWRE